jgi:hypothetical protein
MEMVCGRANARIHRKKRHQVKVPPPEKRLCKKHGKPIYPSKWLEKHRTTECSKCVNNRTRSPQARARRAKKFDEGDIRCINHPERKANRSQYVLMARRKCGSCSVKWADGTLRPSFNRHNKKASNKRNYRRAVKCRERYLGGTLYGLRLFERLTGMQIPLGRWRVA